MELKSKAVLSFSTSFLVQVMAAFLSLMKCSKMSTILMEVVIWFKVLLKKSKRILRCSMSVDALNITE
jgi:hypothetical protein